MKRARIGDLDQRVTLQRRVETPDGAGGVTRDWVTLTAGTVWAKVTPRVVREGTENGRPNAVARNTFTIRYRADLDETCRVQWQGANWNIVGVLRTSQREQFMDFDAERGAAE